jgi:hypothetical protein
MASEQFEIIMSKVQQLSPEEQLQLIKRVAESLAERRKSEKRYLTYGKYASAAGHESTEKDFKLAEWHPTEEWVDGQ